ncbi:MAG: SCO family protein [Rhodobacteraceae bacterium]|nr:SCO family protein [Paracoccaceae bacterium]
MTRYIAIAAAGLVAVVLVGTYVITLTSKPDDIFAACDGGAVAGGEIGGPFELGNKDGQTVTDKDVITEPSLIYFGYTFCPDVCPLDVSRNAEAVDVLAERGQSVTPIFVSIDPDRDTPEVVGQFAEVMHDKMIGLTGSPDQVAAASKAYKTYYKKQDGDDPDYYLVDHSTFTYLTMPEYGTVGFFRRDMSADQMADAVGCFLDHAAE